MRRIFGIIAALMLLPLATTCGTFRALQGDFASKAPQLLAITPTQVVSGAFVDFEAQVLDLTGDSDPLDDDAQAGGDSARVGDVLYFWDFGGAAEPNTSTEPSPMVQIRDGVRSPYDATLTLTDATPGGEDKSATFDFEIFVTPLVIADVTPSTGVAGGSATFSALIESGNVQTYQWDFGGAADPSGSTNPSPQVTFTSAGTYNARLIVSNNFEAAEFPFEITVLPDPNAE